MHVRSRIRGLALLLAALMLLAGCAAQTPQPEATAPGTAAAATAAQADRPADAPTRAPVDRDGAYFGRDEVALYIHLYGALPHNFITKAEARKLGWSGGSVEPYAPGKAIGGDRFGNYEGALPNKKGRQYTECDIDTLGAASRGARRIIFSNDGLVYYTGDHYATFEQLYGGR